MTYQIGNIKIASDELAAGKRVDINCAFWIKRIQQARQNAIAMTAIFANTFNNDLFEIYLHDELAAIGVKIL